MRILMLSWEYPPRIVGGIARHVEEISEALVAQGHEVHVVTADHPGTFEHETVNGVHLHRVKNWSFDPPDFLSWSHGEGFVRFFEERMGRQGIYFLDEPESALSPKRQLELLRLLHQIQASASAQIIMATHSPILMAVPGARLLEITRGGLMETELRETRHFRLYQDFASDPEDFIERALRDEV